ncbi:polysaccharide biosynthesis C-terminal domain-containing protein [Aurantibacter crassamenti]|uniref:oligosaccharide flippase family protein n=1 Tax=Aurantibacter crassamenti TaxID=1837375 RepID=UPI0019392720|nr:polysaccharide biosynthesis C-terminal domain-containing protein [Aurantibacter crassamenti]MBM1106763.1 polysaccharide biosynthesis C-terminal domain-containing protein [Aurantibacter crassamenti]
MASFLNDIKSMGLSKILIIAFGFATSVITARYLGPEKNGIIASLLVYPGLFMSIGSLGIRQSTAYFLGKNLFTESQIKTAISQIWFLTSIVSLIVCFLLMRYLSHSGENLLLVILALVPIPFSLFNTYNSGIFLGKNQISIFNKINWIPTLILLSLTLIFVVWFSFDIPGYMTAMIGGPMFISVILLFKNKFIKSFSLSFDWKIIKSMLSLGMVYAISLLVINLNYKLDVVLLDYLSVPFETGIYTKGSNITQYLWQIPMLFSTIVFARSAVAKKDREFSFKITQLLRISIPVIAIGSILLVLFSEFIIIKFYGEAFRGSINVLNILIPGVLLLTVYKVMNMDLAGKGKPWISMKAMLPSLLINIILNIIFIPEYGAAGASFASTVSYSIAAILFLHFYSKEVQIPIKTILRYKKGDFEPIFQILRKFKN